MKKYVRLQIIILFDNSTNVNDFEIYEKDIFWAGESFVLYMNVDESWVIF